MMRINSIINFVNLIDKYMDNFIQEKKLRLNSNTLDITNIKWFVSDISVATIDLNGVVYAHKEGETDVTATLENGISTTCKVIVQNKEIMPESITLNNTNLNLSIGQTYNLVTKIKPVNSTNKTVVWTSNNTNIVEVNNGIIR